MNAFILEELWVNGMCQVVGYIFQLLLTGKENNSRSAPCAAMRQRASRAATIAGRQSYSLLQQEKITKVKKKKKALKVAEDAKPVQ